ILVQSVVVNTPADKAGLKRNDVILEYDGQPVTDVTKFRLKVADTPIGKDVPLLVMRDGKRMTLQVHLQERTQAALAQAQPSQNDATPGSTPASIAGLTVQDLTDEERSTAGVHSGVVVK